MTDIEMHQRVKCVAHKGKHRGVVVHRLSDEFYAVCWDREMELRALNERAWLASRQALDTQDGFCLTKVDAIESTEWLENESEGMTWPNTPPR